MTSTTLEKLILNSSEVRADAVATPENTAKADDKDTTEQPADEPTSNTITGYALKFNEPSKDLGGFTEIISATALDNTDLTKVVLLFNHDYNQLLASAENNNLKLMVDETGLQFTANLDTSVSYVADAYKQIQNGNLSHCSFSFDVADGGDTFTTDEQGNTVRTVNTIEALYDVSVVSIAAYDETEVSTTAARSYENYINSEKESETNMTKTTLDPKNTESESRSFISFVRSRGEKRDGLNTESGKILIPEAVTKPVLEDLSRNDLASYATQYTVGSSMGKIPVISDSAAVLATKEELAAIADSDSGIGGVNYEVKTRAGKIVLSNELLDDSSTDLKAIITRQLQRLVLNTNNTNISTLLAGIKAKDVTGMDDIVKAFDGTLDPNFKQVAITNMTGLAYLDTLKYTDGHYMLMDDVTSPSGKSLFGLPLLVVNDKFLAGTSLFIGSLEEAVGVVTRNNIQVSYDLFDNYGTSFAAILRSDYQLLNTDAMLNLNLKSATAPAAK